MAIWRSALAFAIAVLVAMQAASASAETDEEFYRGKTLRVIVGFPAGGGFPAPQGFYYCGVGADEVFGRPVVEAHLDACLAAGLAVYLTVKDAKPRQK